MRVRVLGPVRLDCDGDTAMEVGPPQRRLVLAALATDAGRLVLQQTLIDRVWGEPPPRGAARTVQTHIAGLRRLLKPPILVRRSGGYVLDVDPDLVDIHRFRRLAAHAAHPEMAVGAGVALWREAIGLWGGVPLAGLSGDWAARVRDAWHLEYRDAVLGWAVAEVEAGDPAVAVGPLTELIDRYPLVESLPAILMRALYAAGRRTDALACYEAARQRLDEELAEPPGSELRAVYQAVLRREPELPVPEKGLRAKAAVPAQLPPDVRGFTGRYYQLSLLDRIAASVSGEAAGTAAVIAAISGTAGVGKTTLAIHWAHRAARLFPDGQLYVNLRGFDPGGALESADVMRAFLDALGVPPERLPADRDALTAFYRTQLARRRMLIVLDNARDAEQVRPLLPGTNGCLTLVTSRNQLAGLVAATGAFPLNLDLFTSGEAHRMLAARLGAHRVAADPDAVDALVASCARLPLALAMVAARAATHPHFPLGTLAAELGGVTHPHFPLGTLAAELGGVTHPHFPLGTPVAEIPGASQPSPTKGTLAAELDGAGTRLDALGGADPATDVRAVFSWSYTAVSPGAARLFRLLGLHPGPYVSAAAAASLAALTPAEVRPLLAELTHAHLVVEHQPGRYSFHDLLRAYARDLVQGAEPVERQRLATRRILDHYLHTAHIADRLINPTRDPIEVSPAESGTTPERPVDHKQALDWFTVEHAVLIAALNLAAGNGYDTHAWQLAWVLTDYHERRAHWHDQAATQLIAVAATARLGGGEAQGRAHRLLARALMRLGDHDGARTHLLSALGHGERARDHAGQAQTHHTLATLCSRQGHHTDALHHAQRALDLYTAIGHRPGMARALNGVGWYHAQLGNHRHAQSYCQQALSMHQELRDGYGQATTWDSLGYVQHHLGHHADAVVSYLHAIDLYRDLGDRYCQAVALIHLGDTHHATDDPAGAAAVWKQALVLLDDLAHPDADQLRTRLMST